MGKKEFLEFIESWLQDLHGYSLEQLCQKPSENSWSLGQTGMHLIRETDHFFDQARTCTRSSDHAGKTKSKNAETVFRNGQFPNERIEGPPSNLNTPQPETKEQLIDGFKKLQNEIGILESLISNTRNTGKTAHPGLGYFNAVEWLQFAEMHFRHHLGQKKRIEDFLRSNYHSSIAVSKDAQTGQ